MRSCSPKSPLLVFCFCLTAGVILLLITGCGIPTHGSPQLVFDNVSDHGVKDTPFAISAHSKSAGAITFSVLNGPAKLSGNIVTVTGVGEVTLQALQASSNSFPAAVTTTAFAVKAASPRLSLQALWSGPYTMALSVNSDSNAPAVFVVKNGPASVSGSILTINGAGQVTVGATQVASGDYSDATATKTLTISPPNLTLSVNSLVFPDTTVGSSSSPLAIQVENSGDLPMQIQRVNAEAGFLLTSLCSGDLWGHSKCQLGVAFSPQSAGQLSGLVVIVTPFGSLPIKVSGNAALPRIPKIISASVSSLNSGDTTEVHIIGSDLDAATSAQAGAMKCPYKPVSASEMILYVSPPAWASGTIGLSVLNGNLRSNGITLPLNAKAVSYDAAVRFAQQATMAVTPDHIREIQSRGFAGWIDWQMSTPMYSYESRSDMVYGTYMANTLDTRYALRQRVTLALKQIYTFGASDQCFVAECGHYWEATLQKDAFGNERDLLTHITLSPLMGFFLSNAGNFTQYPFVGDRRPNQNFARELMQLMSIGLFRLNHDGSMYLDANGSQTNNYTQDNIFDMAAALGGYHSVNNNPMIPMGYIDAGHSPLAKDPLPGLHLPAGQGTAADTKAVLDALFNHPNIGPFLCRRFIQHMVTSNPSPAYISRVADVFDDNGSGVRGDLAAVIRAILLDSEARRGDDPATAVDSDSHMLEPLLYVSNVIPAVGGAYSDDRVYLVTNLLRQDLFMSPSVFGPYSPDNRIPSGEYAPEAQLVSDAGYIERITFVNAMVKEGLPGLPADLSRSPFYNAPDNASLLEQMRHFLFHGRMPRTLDDTLQAYVNANPTLSPNQLLPGLCTIALTSSSYQVVR